MFLKNRSVNVSLVNDKKSEPAAPAAPNPILTKIDQITAKDVVKVTAGVVATYASIVAVNTLARIAENRFTN